MAAAEATAAATTIGRVFFEWHADTATLVFLITTDGPKPSTYTIRLTVGRPTDLRLSLSDSAVLYLLLGRLRPGERFDESDLLWWTTNTDAGWPGAVVEYDGAGTLAIRQTMAVGQRCEQNLFWNTIPFEDRRIINCWFRVVDSDVLEFRAEARGHGKRRFSIQVRDRELTRRAMDHLLAAVAVTRRAALLDDAGQLILHYDQQPGTHIYRHNNHFFVSDPEVSDPYKVPLH